MMIWRPTEGDLKVAYRLGLMGIYAAKEVAAMLDRDVRDLQTYAAYCLSEGCRNELLHSILKGKTVAKEELLQKMRQMALTGQDEGFSATRYLLQANHGLNEHKAQTKASLRMHTETLKERKEAREQISGIERKEINVDDFL